MNTLPNISTLAGRLRYARKAAKLTQLQLAEAIGVSQGIVSQIETGTNKQTVYIAQLATACGVDAGWLATGQSVRAVTIKPLQNANDRCSETPVPDKIKKWSDIQGGAMLCGRFLYKIESDIMTGQSGAHIPNGATLTVEAGKKPSQGSIVIADIDGAPWVGHISIIGTRHYIRPSNPQYPAIEADARAILGVVVSYSVQLAP
jgi:SOS-response transcriptional repressor LexA